MSDLYERLKKIKSGQKGRIATGSHRAPKLYGAAEDSYVSPGTDWEILDDGVFCRKTSFLIGEGSGVTQSGTWDPLSPVLGLGPRAYPLCIDIETTGLSGGAGNVAFLVGVARLTPSGSDAILTQFFLGDFDAEPAFLSCLEKELMPAVPADLERGDIPIVYVTYNGSRFDLPVLRSRFLLNRRQFPEAIHFDALHITRRFYARQIGSCTLTSVEREVLGTTRDLDIPSAEVPERYLDYLRSRSAGRLEPVFSHHAADIENLCRLALLLNHELVTVVAKPTVDRSAPKIAPKENSVSPVRHADRVAVSRLLLERGGPIERGAAIALLERLCRETEDRRRLAERDGPSRAFARRAGSGLPDGWIEARRLLVVEARRAGDYEAMGSILKELFVVRGDAIDAVDYAKYLEHRAKDPSAALEVLRQYQERTGDWSDALEYRGARLKRKIAGRPPR